MFVLCQTQNVTTSIKLGLSTEDKSWNLEGTCNLDLHSYLINVLKLSTSSYFILFLFFLASISHDHLWWLLTRDFNGVTVQIKNGVVIVAPARIYKKRLLWLFDQHLSVVSTFYTWNNEREGKNIVTMNLDRVLGNDGWLGRHQNLRHGQERAVLGSHKMA